MVTDERIALDVEEQVTGAGLGQQREPAPSFRREQLVRRQAGPTGVDLQPRLLPKTRARGRALDRLRQRLDRGATERLDGRDPGGGEPVGVVAAHRRDPAQVRVVAPPLGLDQLVTPAVPMAVLAVTGGDHVGHRDRQIEHRQQARASQRGVGGGICIGEPLLPPVTGDHGEPLGRSALQLLELPAVRGQLDDCRHLEPAGQLRVSDVVRPGAEPAASVIAPDQEVCVAAPRRIEEGRLVDHLNACLHGRGSRLAGGDQATGSVGARDREHRATRCPKRRQVAHLVQSAAPGRDDRLAGRSNRPRQPPERDHPVH